MDTLNSFIQTHIEYDKDMYIINIRGDVYGTYAITERKSIKQLICQCQKEIYGTMTASLIYYKRSRNSIEDESYEFNPYDPFFANKITKDIQMTVCFHLDDCKLSRKSPKVVGKTVTRLKK